MDRYFSSRVRRLYREKGWSMAEFSRRTRIGRAKLQRLLDNTSNAYLYGWVQGDIEPLAGALNVTVEYLRYGNQIAIRSSETETQREISRLRVENDRLRSRRNASVELEQTLLHYATEKKLEIRYRDNKFIVVSEHEFEIAEAANAQRALELALAGDALINAR